MHLLLAHAVLAAYAQSAERALRIAISAPVERLAVRELLDVHELFESNYLRAVQVARAVLRGRDA